MSTKLKELERIEPWYYSTLFCLESTWENLIVSILEWGRDLNILWIHGCPGKSTLVMHVANAYINSLSVLL